MATYLLVVAAALAAEPPPNAASGAEEPAPSNASAVASRAQRMRDAISDALRREATTMGAAHDDAVRNLVDVYDKLKADPRLPDAERRRRLGQIRSRLAGVARQLERDHVDRAARRPVAGQTEGARGSRFLAQQVARPPAGGRAAGGAAGRAPPRAASASGEVQGAEQLIDLIRNTIAPDSWDIRGGPGTIMYFPPKKVLVIRQTGRVHRQFGDLVRQLRRN